MATRLHEHADEPTAEDALATVLRREQDKLLDCVHCGFCLTACPTYTRLGDEGDSPRGRLYLMRAVVEGRLAPDAEAFALHLDRCLGCRACETVCPSGVRYGFLFERARAVIARATRLSVPTRLILVVFGSRVLTSILLAPARALRDVGFIGMLVQWLPERFGRLRFALALLAGTRPRQLPVRDGGAARARRDATPHTARVGMLTGCVQRALFGHVNRATAKVLRASGCEVAPVRGQRCCGALHAHAGDLDGARTLARSNVDAFARERLDAIVVNAAGCGAFMKEYGELLEAEPRYAARAADVAGKVRDVFEYLTEVDAPGGAPLPLRVAYDAPCHLYHGQGIRSQPMDVLRRVPDLEVEPLPRYDECCGSAGTYGLLHPELGGRILHDKVAEVRQAAPDVVATGNPGCIMQIAAGLLLRRQALPVVHPVELLAESYRRQPPVRSAGAAA